MKWILPIFFGCACVLLAGSAHRPLDVADRYAQQLAELKPSEPIAYFQLAEEISDALPDDAEAIRLARLLYGTAGRLDLEGLGSSSALAIAQITRDSKERMRLRAAATMLDPMQEDVFGFGPGGSVDSETALEISEAFGAFRTGRGQRLRQVLSDPARRQLLVEMEEQLPAGGVTWLETASRQSRGRPELDRNSRAMMLRIEVRLLEGATPSWSSEALGGGAMPLLQITRDEIDEMLGGEPQRPYWRDGRWVDVRGAG